MKRLLCLLIGHDFDSTSVHFGYTYRCSRCEKEDIRLPRWKRALHYPKALFADWCKPCADCGKRFDRHDDSIDHVPF